ncbi:MAG: hypothetical protein ACRDU4_11815, partial [Mycobacterium sp.]
MCVPDATQGRAIFFQHRGEYLQPGVDRQLEELGPRIDEQINKREMALRGIVLVRPIDCARLSFHGGSLLAGFRPGLVTGRIARPVRSRRSQILTTTGTSPRVVDRSHYNCYYERRCDKDGKIYR